MVICQTYFVREASQPIHFVASIGYVKKRNAVGYVQQTPLHSYTVPGYTLGVKDTAEEVFFFEIRFRGKDSSLCPSRQVPQSSSEQSS